MVEFYLSQAKIQKTKSRDSDPAFCELLARWDDFRTLKWIDAVKCPELMITQVKELLSIIWHFAISHPVTHYFYPRNLAFTENTALWELGFSLGEIVKFYIDLEKNSFGNK